MGIAGLAGVLNVDKSIADRYRRRRMIRGNELWDVSVTGDMVEKCMPEAGNIWTFPNLPDNVYEAVKKIASVYAEKTALVSDEGRAYSYRDFLERCQEFSAYLYGVKGVRAGSHVGIMLHNTPEYCIAYYALSRLGAVTICLPSKYKRAEVLSLAKRSDMEYLICETEYAGWFREDYAEEQIACAAENAGYDALYEKWEKREQDLENLAALSSGKPEANAMILFTSGTTSMSKGVLLKNYQVMHAIEAYRRILQVTEEDISVIATPIYHITGLAALLGLFLSTGGTLYLHKRFNAGRVIREAREYGVTFLHASPTVFHLFLQEGEHTPEIPGLVTLACGSSYMAKEKLRRLHRWLPNSQFHTVYGLTETSSPATIFPGDAAESERIGSSGRPIPGMEFKIVDEERRELPCGQVGEIAVKGCNVVVSYYRQHTESLEDGWLYTGDLGYFDEDSYLYVVDRKKNMINRGGEKIWCYDVENELTSIEGVLDAAVVGLPDEVYGEVPAAVVEIEKGCALTVGDIRQYLHGRIAKYKIPVKIMEVEEIPQTVNGKPDKGKIQELLEKEIL